MERDTTVEGSSSSKLPDVDPHLRIWAVDVSAWPKERAQKESIQALANELFAGKVEDTHRVTKYFQGIDRTRSLAALLLPRLAVRLCGSTLGLASKLSWDHLAFQRTKEGRPYLSQPTSSPVFDFNISHDGDWVVMAFRTVPEDRDRNETVRVGIDVMGLSLPHFEQSPATFLETMSDSMTAEERLWVASALPAAGSTKQPAEADEALQRLYDLWTYKEALTKNLGMGLGFDFKRVQVGLWKCQDANNRRKRRTVLPTRSHDDEHTVLSMDGSASRSYTFTEVTLPAGKGNVSAGQRKAGSKVVVCLGPHEDGIRIETGSKPTVRLPQIRPSITQDEAVRSDLLRIWTMQELVDAAEQERRQ